MRGQSRAGTSITSRNTRPNWQYLLLHIYLYGFLSYLYKSLVITFLFTMYTIAPCLSFFLLLTGFRAGLDTQRQPTGSHFNKTPTCSIFCPFVSRWVSLEQCWSNVLKMTASIYRNDNHIVPVLRVVHRHDRTTNHQQQTSNNSTATSQQNQSANKGGKENR